MMGTNDSRDIYSLSKIIYLDGVLLPQNERKNTSNVYNVEENSFQFQNKKLPHRDLISIKITKKRKDQIQHGESNLGKLGVSYIHRQTHSIQVGCLFFENQKRDRHQASLWQEKKESKRIFTFQKCPCY